jgi:RND family efflux transporter MFP subunit
MTNVSLLSRMLLLSSLFFLSLTSFAGEAKQAVFESTVPVEVNVVSFNDYAKPLRVSGLLENKSEQTLAFKVSGLVAKVYVDEGQLVKKGQRLAILNLEEIDAQVAKAQAVLANAERNLERFKSLQGRNALSVDQLQASETQVDVARSDLTVAKFNRRHAEIKAPANGRILKRSIDQNELAASGQAAFIFASKKQGWVLRTGVTDKDIVRLGMTDSAELKFDAYPNEVFKAQVSELAGRADNATQTFEIELRLEALEGKNQRNLLAGFVGHGRIYPSNKESLALLPLTSVLRTKAEQAEVFVLDADNKAHLRTVNIAFIEGGFMAVRDGVRQDERIVIQGAPYLSEGSGVSVHIAANR